jgi:hypothetical protein
MTRDDARTARGLAAVLLVAFALKLAIVVAALDRGFELGDEGFFLLNLRYPEAAPPPQESYRVLGRLCGGSCDIGVVVARVCRVAAELAGSIALIGGVFLWARARVFVPGAVGPWTFLAWCLLGTLLSLESRSLGYNDLTNLLCFSAVGALFAIASLPPGAVLRRGLLAVAMGALLGLQLPVKWPTAVLLIVLVSSVVAWGFPSWTRRERVRVLACAASGLAVSAGLVVLAVGGAQAAKARFDVASELIALTAHEPLELLRGYVVLDKFSWLHVAIFIAYFAVAFGLARRRAAESRDRTLASGLGGAAAVMLAAVLVLHPTFLHESALFLGGLLIALPLLLLAAAAHRARRAGASGSRDLPANLPLLALLFALPFVVIAGTNVTMTMRLPTHGLPLYVLLAVLVLDLGERAALRRFRNATGVLLLAATSVVFVRHHVLHPYGVPRPIYEQRHAVWGLPGVRVDAETRDFLTKLALTMTELGFRRGDPVLAFDYMPGLVYYLGATSPRYNFYMFRSPAFNCYNANRAQLSRPPFVILAKPMNVGQLGCLKAFRFPDDFRMPRTLSFPYEKAYEGFSARGFSKLYLYAPRDVAERNGR